MDAYLWVAMSGANAALSRQAVTANNLANANTTGYRAAEAAARALPVVGGGLPTRVYAVTQTAGAKLTVGPITRTGRALDVAINGPGWIVVRAPDGRPALTRDGNLAVGATGLLETATGHPLLGGNRRPISVPPMSSLVIGADGTVSGVPLGSQPNAPVTLGRILLVNPAAKNLLRGADGLFRSRLPLVGAADVRLEPRALEGSNVNTINALLNLIQDSRSFETQIRLARTSADNAQVAARILQI